MVCQYETTCKVTIKKFLALVPGYKHKSLLLFLVINTTPCSCFFMMFHLVVGGKKQIVIKTLGNNKMLFHLAVGYHFYTTPP